MEQKSVLGWCLVAVIFCMGMLAPVIIMTAYADSGKGPFIDDELIVQHKAGVAEGKIREVLQGQGASVEDEITPLRVKKIRVPAHAREKVKAALAKNPHITFVEDNFIAEATVTPDDTYYPSQWHLPNISAPLGWDLSTGSVSVPVAIADSGVDPLHADLSGKLIPGYNFYAGNADTRDIFGHGTKVAGAAAALSNNAGGVAGVAWESPIMPIVISDSTGYATYFNMAQAITYAADHDIRVINLSFAGSSASSTLQSAVNYAWNKGTIVFASAGNFSTSTPYYPAACDNVVAVSATTSSDTLASFSNFGSWIDLSAPGSGIYTTTKGGGYAAASGTSFASPITAGLAALVLSVNPGLTNAQVVDILQQNSDDLGAPGFDPYFGYGRINAYGSLAAAMNYVPQPDTTAPLVSIVSPAEGSVAGGAATVNVSAADNEGVVRVELHVDGAFYADDAAGPYSFSWDTRMQPDGLHTLSARAFDAAGNIGESAPVAVSVSNPKDTTSPSVRIASPLNGSILERKAAISAGASDDVGVVRMELAIDGKVMATSSGSSLSYSWNTVKAAPGSHTIRVQAYDAAGNGGAASVIAYK